MYAENCDKSVLKRLLKQLWKIVMKSLERNIVLPPINEKVNIVLPPINEKVNIVLLPINEKVKR